jgi:hypothetical protein
MFGRGKLLRDGAQTQGVVVESRRTGSGGIAEGDARLSCQVRVRVSFEDGSKAEVSSKLYGRLYVEGDILPVRYDPDDHSKIEVDLPALEAGRQADVARGQALNVARGEAELAQREAGEDPRWLMKTMSAMHTAKQAGYLAEYERLQSEVAAWEAKTAVGSSGGSPDGAGGPGIASSDRIDQLQRLAELHKSGALSDVEFASEKAKILGQS